MLNTGFRNISNRRAKLLFSKGLVLAPFEPKRVLKAELCCFLRELPVVQWVVSIGRRRVTILDKSRRLNPVSSVCMFRTWPRVVVILILSWAVIDDCVPGFCAAESSAVPAYAVTSASPNSRSSPMLATNNVPQQNKDGYTDDCFCCSTHVVPTQHFTLAGSAPSVPAIVLVPQTRTEDRTPLLYHPPCT